MRKLNSIKQFVENAEENILLKKENFRFISGGNRTSDVTWQCTDQNVAGCQTDENRDARKYIDGAATMDITADCDRMKDLTITCD